MKYTPLFFLGQTFNLHKKDQSKCKFLDFLVLRSKFTIFLSFLKQKAVSLQILHHSHSAHWGIKNTIPVSLAKPPLNRQNVQAPNFLVNLPLYIGFS